MTPEVEARIATLKAQYRKASDRRRAEILAEILELTNPH